MPARKAAAPKKETATKETVHSNSLWAYVGTDDLQVKEAAARKARELTPPEDPDFGLEVIEGGADNSEHAQNIIASTIEAIQTLPFFGGQKVVWLKGVSFLADNVTGRAEGTLRALERLQKLIDLDMPGDVKLVISALEVDKRRAFFLFLKKAANLVVHDLIDVSKSGWEDHVAQLVRERAREYGLKFEGDAMEYFNAMAGENTRQIENELEKLDLYVGERRVVTANDVRDIVPQTKNSIIFELGNAIISRQLGLALAMVDVLLEQGENAVGILLAAVVPKIKSLAQVKYYEENFRISAGKSYNEYAAALGRLPERERARLPQKKDGTGLNVYGLYMSAREAGNFTGAELRSALEECLLANRRLVTTALDPVIVFNQLLFRILATKG